MEVASPLAVATHFKRKYGLMPSKVDKEHERSLATGGEGITSSGERCSEDSVTGPALLTVPCSLQVEDATRSQLTDLLAKCLQLDQENKITVRNTWELKLIDHLTSLVHIFCDEDQRPDFQKVSCMVAAAAKIYSTRVDSVHSEGYKVLGTLNRTGDAKAIAGSDCHGEEDETKNGKTQRTGNEDKGSHNVNLEQVTGSPNPEDTTGIHGDRHFVQETEIGELHEVFKQKLITHSVTLEKNIGSLNSKSSDGAKPSDAYLYCTLSQYFKGGPESLLLNNLSVYEGCEVVFDPWEIPEKRMRTVPSEQIEKSKSVNVSFMKDTLLDMMVIIDKENEITPTLKKIFEMLDDPYRTLAEEEVPTSPSVDSFGMQFSNDEAASEALSEVIDQPYVSCNDEERVRKNEVKDVGGDFISNWLSDAQTPHINVVPLQSRDFAETAHWKYPNHRDDPECTAKSVAGPKSKASNAVKKERRTPQSSVLLDFENPPDIDYVSALAPSCHHKSPVPTQILTRTITLLEEALYDEKMLVHFFLRPSVSVFADPETSPLLPFLDCRGSQLSDKSSQRRGGISKYTQSRLHHGDSYTDFDDAGCFEHRQNKDSENFDGDLVPAPYKIQKLELVNYHPASTVVDVHKLKETLWDVIQGVQADAQALLLYEEHCADSGEGMPFQKVLDLLPANVSVDFPEEFSVPICFMCLLHLANEHNLVIKASPTKDDLRIFPAEFETRLSLGWSAT